MRYHCTAQVRLWKVQTFVLVLACRRVKSERASASFASNMDDVVVPMDSLGEAFDRLANDNRVGSYVKAGAR